MNWKIKDWNELKPGIFFKIRRGADGPGVLVDPRDWSEVPFDKDAHVFLGDVECAGTKTTMWSIPSKVLDSSETELE